MKRTFIILLVISLFVLVGCSGKTYVKIKEEPVQKTDHYSRSEAVFIAQQSPCAEDGVVTDEAFYNSKSKTWWVDMKAEKKGCNPACVVNELSRQASTNWRCTGLRR
ncbi:MAG: hypothetical protein ACE5DM_04725 [Candidatus Nanoarchaeia archaeon]